MRKAEMKNGRLVLSFPFDLKLIGEVKKLKGATFHDKKWIVDLTVSNIEGLKDLNFQGRKEYLEFAKENEREVDVSNISINVNGLNATLYPYQEDALKHVKAFNDKCLLNLDCGLGKTLCAISHYQLNRHKWPKMLIIVPSILKLSWQRELKKFIGCDSQILNGRTQKEIIENIVIINYDVLWSWRATLRKQKFDVVVFDEIHYLASPKSKRSKGALSVSKNAKSVLGLTGTPIKGRVAKLWNPTRLVNGEIFPNQRDFEERYAEGFFSSFGWVAKGCSNAKELAGILKRNVMYRRTKREVFKDLPKVTETIISVDIKKSEYNRILNNFKTWLSANGKKSSACKLAQLTTLRIETIARKEEHIKTFIDNFIESGNKLVVFGVHKIGLTNLRKHYKNNSVLVNGDVKNKQELVDKFVDDDNIKIFFGNISACGTGVDGLQRVCSDILFIETSYCPIELYQCKSRLDRIGQKNSVNINYLFAKQTVDEDIFDINKDKQNSIDEVLEGKISKDVSGELMRRLAGR